MTTPEPGGDAPRDVKWALRTLLDHLDRFSWACLTRPGVTTTVHTIAGLEDLYRFKREARAALSATPAPRPAPEPTDTERLDWLSCHSPCSDWKPLTSLSRGQIDALMRRPDAVIAQRDGSKP